MKRIFGFLLVILAGCGGVTVTPMPEAVPVSGKVAMGTPPKDLQVHFQPLGDGHPVAFAVQADGTFRGKAAPGRYSYYAQTVSRSLPKTLREPAMDRTIDVPSGGGDLGTVSLK